MADESAWVNGSAVRVANGLRCAVLFCSVALITGAVVAAENWTGRVGGALVWQDASGNEDSFLTQYNLRQGFILDDLQLDYRGSGRLQEFTVNARGFGSAYPSEFAKLDFRFRGGVGLVLDYDKRASFFNLAGSDFPARADDWDITRLKGAVVIDSWKPLKASVIVRRYQRDGTVNRPFYGLNELYPVGIDLDESMSEGTVRLETRTLPVQIDFEQSWTRYESKNRRFPAGTEAIGGTDPDLLASASTDVDDTRDGPTTRFGVSYANSWFQGMGTVLWSDTDLETGGASQSSYAVGGGPIGSISFIDELIGSAQNESLFGALNLSFRMARHWIFRFDGQTREASTDSALLGCRLVRGTSDLGTPVEFRAPVNENGTYDSTDTNARLRVEYRRRTWSLWGGVFGASRDVAWRRTVEDVPFKVERTSDGFLLGATVTPGRYLNLDLEYERGDFTRFVFRIDPGTVDRAVVKLRSKLGRGWQLGAHGRYETADNPPEVASLDFRSMPYGITAAWSSPDGVSSAGIDLERMQIESDVALVLPGGTPGLSRYDLDVSSITAHGQTRAGIVKFRGSGTYLDDSGETWPLQSWNVIARVTVEKPAGLEYGVFLELWSYDEDRLSLDDYDVTRAGVSLLWSF